MVLAETAELILAADSVVLEVAAVLIYTRFWFLWQREQSGAQWPC